MLALALSCTPSTVAPSTAFETAEPSVPLAADAGDPACHTNAPGPGDRDLFLFSGDGVSFEAPIRMQHCADVPSMASDGSSLLAAFQSFAEPGDPEAWDRIAVRRSDDGGETWGELLPATFDGLPEGMGTPFDPALVWTGAGWRLYFSMGTTEPATPDDSVCTHAAWSDDGSGFTYETEVFCVDGAAVIDPTVALWSGIWYYSAPAGKSEDGARMATSADGLRFEELGFVSSDETHAWIGNLVVRDEFLVFYGAQPKVPGGHIWFATTSDGTTWTEPISTSIPGGKDPGAVVLGDAVLLLVPELPM